MNPNKFVHIQPSMPDPFWHASVKPPKNSLTVSRSNTVRETKWTKKIIHEMELVGAQVFRCVASAAQGRGWPDRYVCHPLWDGWLEFKGEHTIIKPIQSERIKRLNLQVATIAYVIRWPDLIQDHAGEYVGRFDQTGHGLLIKLSEIRACY